MQTDGHDPPIEPGKRLTATQVEDQFRELFQAELAKSAHTIESVARQLGMTGRNLQRILNGQQKLTAGMLVDIGNALAIDKTRATVAVERFSDWRAYYDATLIIAVDLLKPVVETVNQLTTTPLDPLHPKAIEQLSTWIAETVINTSTRSVRAARNWNLPARSEQARRLSPCPLGRQSLPICQYPPDVVLRFGNPRYPLHLSNPARSGIIGCQGQPRFGEFP